MAIPSTLKTSSRSAYRNLWRAASATFSGDVPVLKAFRLKMRDDAINFQSIADPKLYEEQIKLNREIADFLRRNVVQAVKVYDTETVSSEERWRVRITKDTELGDNDSVKNPPPMETSQSTRKQGKTSSVDAAPHDDASVATPSSRSSPTQRMNYSALKRAHKERTLPELREDDLEESFVRGSGPGGQSINKTENCVQLLHKPTGIRVSCQETRSLKQNRMLARRLVLEKLDKLQNPGLSKKEMNRAKQVERERRRRKKAKKRALAKEQPQSEHENDSD
ncbi:RF-1 domain-containing protein [Cyathus striatus]|nr:RF-1 domain-containing protein [Cyathus striatus]